ncbi:hypothetical protein [Floccifex sp.]|uniref:hypothetical protein n=1 Tax=Floccifex sp. TaxID=2815810 RepID=UPI003F07D5F0
MKKIKYIIMICVLCFFSGCTKSDPYQQIEITTQELQEKLENKETFNFMVIRENCDFCASLENYIELTKQEHNGIVLYTLDSTDFDFSRENEDDCLSSSTSEGQYLLSLCPYFLYTPTIYVVQDGQIVTSGIGFNDMNKSVSIWQLDSFIDFNTADEIEFWDFISD